MERGVEALLLGLSAGLVCVASCGAVLVPWLVAQQRGVHATALLLAQVLAGRLAGYLLFASFAWAAGLVLVSDDVRVRLLLFGGVYVALAAILAWYALGSPRTRWPGPLTPCPADDLPRHVHERDGTWTAPAAKARPSILLRLYRYVAHFGPAGLGFLTGINLCPPFIVASVRAAQLASLPASLGFFTLFFVGTSVWFLPFLAAGAARRIPEARFVARVAMGVVAAYYGYMGAMTLGWGMLHG